MRSRAPILWFVCVTRLAWVTPAYADEGFATTAFEQAETLRKGGAWEPACRLYLASYKADPQLGVLLHLADCNEHIGKTATAFLQFTDAIDLAHKQGDPREKLANKRALALANKVAKLHLAPPPTLIPNLVVKRDDEDVTALVGADLPIDPGTHDLVATAPNHVDWTTQVTIAPVATITTVQVPTLELVPPVDPAAATAPHGTKVPDQGTLEITTRADATILVDGKRVGVGRYSAPVIAGGHEVIVVAPGMRPYHDDVLVGVGQVRQYTPMLELANAERAPPSFELAIGFAPGIKVHPGVHTGLTGLVAYRAELTFRIGARVNFGAFTEIGSIDTSDTCGFDMPGPTPKNPFDYGTRYRMDRCAYVTPGLQLNIHLLPQRQLDPYVSVATGVRFGLTTYTTFVGGGMAAQTSETFRGYSASARVGLDIHLYDTLPGWGIGPFLDAELTAYSQESCATCDGGVDSPATFASVFAGLRSSIAF